MPVTHILHFEGKPIRTHHLIDGQLWFNGNEIALILGYPDDTDALSLHCSRHGVSPGDGSRPAQLIDLGNVYRLILASGTAQAGRFEGWLRQEGLPRLIGLRWAPRSEVPTLKRSFVDVLSWHGKRWVSIDEPQQSPHPHRPT